MAFIQMRVANEDKVHPWINVDQIVQFFGHENSPNICTLELASGTKILVQYSVEDLRAIVNTNSNSVSKVR